MVTSNEQMTQELVTPNDREEYIKSLFETPGNKAALDLSFMYDPPKDNETPEITDFESRISAAWIASTRGSADGDPTQVYLDEFEKLRAMDKDTRKSYTESRIRFEAKERIDKDMTKVLTEIQRNAVSYVPKMTNDSPGAVAVTPSGEGLGLTLADRFHYQAMKQQMVAQSPEFGGEAVSVAMATARTPLELDMTKRLILDTATNKVFTALEYNEGDFNPFKSENPKQLGRTTLNWGKEIIDFRMTWETLKHDTGPLDIAEIKKMPLDEYKRRLDRTTELLIKEKASPITVVSVLSAFDAEASPVLQGIFLGLDVLPAFGYIRLAGKASRAFQRYRIARMYTNAVGAAARTGAQDVAARLAAIALTSRGTKVASNMGLDKVTAALNASPFPWAALAPEVIDGAAHDILRYVERDRQLMNYYLSLAVNPYLAETGGMLRAGEAAAYERALIPKLPTGAQITERTPLGLWVKVTTPNPKKFATAEELASAEKRYNVWRDTYENALKELDRFNDEIKNGHWEMDQNWVNRLENNKTKAKKEMDDAWKVLDKGLEKDVVEDNFIFYTRDEFTGSITGVLEGNPIWSKTLSADGYLRIIDQMVVPERTKHLARQEQLLTIMQKTMREVAYGLSKKQMKNVDAVLTYGSDSQQVFPMQKLIEGIDVPGVGTIKLKKKEIASYYKYRDAMDATFGMRAFMDFKELGWKGYTKQSVVTLLNDVGDVIRPSQKKLFLRDWGLVKNADGTTSIRLPEADKILDATGRGAEAHVISITDEEVRATLKARLAKGEIVMANASESIRLGDEAYDYVLVRANRLQDLKPDALGYRKGYVPNIHRAPYVVREARKIKFNGRDTLDINYTVRFFKTREEAEVWRLAQPNHEKLITDADSAWRAKDPLYAQEVDDAVHRGLFEDYRGEKIPYGANADVAPVESAFVAMDRYLDNLAWTYPLNDWREGVLARYFNAVNPYLVIPNNLQSPFIKGLSREKEEGIIAFRDWISDQLSITSEGERAFSRWVKQRGENVETSTFWKFVKHLPYGEEMTEAARLKLLYGAENANAYGFIRAAAFNTYLGAFNISQTFVQAANAAVVMMMHPLNAPSVIRRMLALRTVAFLNPADPDYEKIVRIAAKAALMKYDEFEPMVRAWFQSGWAYTTRSSADTRTVIRRLSPGGAIRQTGRSIHKASLMFFTEGELFGRAYGFLDSYTRLSRKAKKAGLVVDWTEPDRVAELIKEATRVSFNYTAANAAYWQKGKWSIPSQFLQVPAKFYEELLAPIFLKKYVSRFSVTERFNMIVGHLALFGIGGIPAGEWIRDNLYEMFTQPSGNGTTLYPNVSDEELAFWTGGIIDLIGHELVQLAGRYAELEDQTAIPTLSRRMSLANGFDLLISNFTSQDYSGADGLLKAIGKSVLGAAGGVLTQQIMPAAAMVINTHGTRLFKTGTFAPEDIFEAASNVAEVAKSWDNIQTARLWAANEAILNANNAVVLPLDPDGSDQALLLLKKLGIDSYQRYAAIRMQDWNKKHDPSKEINNALKSANALLMSYTKDGRIKQEKYQRQFNLELGLIAESLKSEEDKLEFQRKWDNMIWNEESKAAKEWKKTLQMMLEYNRDDVGALPVDAATVERQLSKIEEETSD